MPEREAGPGKVRRMQTRYRRVAGSNGSEWSNQQLQEWAAPEKGEPVFMSKLKRMLVAMIQEGKAQADGTDRDGNPTFTFK